VFELYTLHRPDKIDPLVPEFWQPFYGGKGRYGREKDHRREAKNLLSDPDATNTNPIRNYIIHKLWEQGLDYIEDVIIIGLTNEEACEYEIEFIAAYGKIKDGTGCLANISDGGDGAAGIEPWNKGKVGLYKHTEERKLKISEANSGENHWLYNGHHKDESKQKMSESHMGEKNHFYNKKHTPETLQQMSESHTGQVCWRKGKKFGPLPEEQKQKISESNSGEKHWSWGIPRPEETRQRISKSNTGKKDSDETRRKKSEGHKGLPGPNTGNIASIETRQRMSISHTGSKRSEETKANMRKAWVIRKLWKVFEEWIKDQDGE
jgi:hypothetical protein